MNKKSLLLWAIAAILVLWVLVFYWQNLRGIWPAIKPPVDDIAEQIPGTIPSSSFPPPSIEPGQETVPFPLKLPGGFSISVFAKNLPGARVMQFDAFGNMWVSRTSEGAITLLEVKNGAIVRQDDVLSGLDKPHGLAFGPDDQFLFYYAEENGISRLRVYSEGKPEKITDLPSDGGHFTRTISFGPDGRLYVSIGSSCNVCYETDDRRAKIFSMDKNGGDPKEYARGLRNSVFFTWHPVTGKMWATEMGRDLLGDNIPPDEINIVRPGANYGWPTCYGKNIHDGGFDKKQYFRNPCLEPFETGSYIDIPAHSAPLGLAFLGGQKWPQKMQNGLLVAYHGSWNRTTPTGYKVVLMRFTDGGAYLGAEDLITGWLTGKGVLGRPVDILVRQDEGAIYISDDKAGVIYKVTYNP